MHMMNRHGWIALVFLLIFFTASASAVTGTIQVVVQPGSGTVCLDTTCRSDQGILSGTGTTIFEGVEAGRYYMLNVYGIEGYRPYLAQVYLDSSGKSLNREITLERIPASARETGSVRVYVTPDGGRVCLDRKCEISEGDGTGSWSVQFTDVSANTYHTITLSKDGYETYATEIRILTGETKTMDISLKPLPPGSTPLPTPVSTPQPTPAPEPTRAALPVTVALFAIGISSVAFLLRRPGH